MVCGNICTQYGLETLMVAGSGTSATAQVTDTSISTTTKAFGIVGHFPNPIVNLPPPQCISQIGPSFCQFTAGQSVMVATSGLAVCQFDNQTFPGDLIATSTFNTGFCHDVGSTVPSADQIIGVVLSEAGVGSFGQPYAQSVFLYGGGTYGSSTANGSVSSAALPRSAEAASNANAPQTPKLVSVTSKSTPAGAEITFDGKFVGNTPSTLMLSAGEHSVRVEKTGYAPWLRKVTLTAGGVVTLDANFEKH
jgi:hypothetical protein